MTRLIHAEDGHSKFWEGTVDGSSLTVRFGRIGTQGQTKVKAFDSAAAANAELAKLVKEKRAKGYVEACDAAAPQPPNAAAKAKLSETLAALDALWREKLPQVSASLRPGIDASTHGALSQILSGGPLPAELATWFAWHDGQASDVALSDESVYSLHSLESAIETWNFLQDMKEETDHPLNPAWLPLFTNGGGDHRCYDLKSGAIVTYYHDSADRDTAFASLEAWAEVTRAGLGKLARSLSIDVSLENLRWIKVSTPPTEGSLGKLEVGTAFHYTQKLAMGVREFVVIKTKGNTWLKSSGPDLAKALAGLQGHLRQPPGKNSGYWSNDSLLPGALKAASKGTLRQCKVSLPA